ncbi:9286_t:CDS:2 [Ambispora leptoticha]|uniref:9286_t:CDS:1 n=1 Tax=Ambispora leptoticha TaxID=144679 RepID=A0A9N9D343_9GLOM|nr:9286_t:CDS:2 [Ambispora leptoticha]
MSTSTPTIQSSVTNPTSPRNIPPNPFDVHEGIPEEQEFEHVAELKRLAAEKARLQTIGTNTGIARGTTASLTQSALGKYSTAIGEEIRAPSLIVQARVKAAEHPVDEAQLVRELKEEAEQRRQFELQTQGYVPRAGPAAKVEEAAEQLEKVLKIEGGQLEATSPPTSPQPMQEIADTGIEVKRGRGNKFKNRGGRGMRNRQQYKYPGTRIPANTNFMRVQNVQRGGFQDQQNIPQVEIGNPHVAHEGIPETQEFEHLAQLKEVTTEHARGLGLIPRGSKAAVAQSAFGKYATAISEETHIPTLSVQGLEEAQRRREFEIQTLGRILPNGPAVKVDESADRLEQVLKMDRVEPDVAAEQQPEEPHVSQSEQSQRLPGDFVAPGSQLVEAGVPGLSKEARQVLVEQQQVTPPASPAQQQNVGVSVGQETSQGRTKQSELKDETQSRAEQFNPPSPKTAEAVQSVQQQPQ